MLVTGGWALMIEVLGGRHYELCEAFPALRLATSPPAFTTQVG